MVEFYKSIKLLLFESTELLDKNKQTKQDSV